LSTLSTKSLMARSWSHSMSRSTLSWIAWNKLYLPDGRRNSSARPRVRVRVRVRTNEVEGMRPLEAQINMECLVELLVVCVPGRANKVICYQNKHRKEKKLK
jgi:hypothetical protein